VVRGYLLPKKGSQIPEVPRWTFQREGGLGVFLISGMTQQLIDSHFHLHQTHFKFREKRENRKTNTQTRMISSMRISLGVFYYNLTDVYGRLECFWVEGSRRSNSIPTARTLGGE